MSDPQGEPATMTHGKHSLGDADIHKARAPQAFSLRHTTQKSTPFTGPTRGVSLLQVAQQDWGELLLSQRSHLVKDAAQSHNAIVDRSKEKVRMTPL